MSEKFLNISKVLIVIIIVTLIIFYSLSPNYMDGLKKDLKDEIYNKSFNNEIEHITNLGKGYYRLKLVGRNQEITIAVYPNYQYKAREERYFINIMIGGDSIYRKAFSDSITIIKRGEHKLYTYKLWI